MPSPSRRTVTVELQRSVPPASASDSFAADAQLMSLTEEVFATLAHMQTVMVPMLRPSVVSQSRAGASTPSSIGGVHRQAVLLFAKLLPLRVTHVEAWQCVIGRAGPQTYISHAEFTAIMVALLTQHHRRQQIRPTRSFEVTLPHTDATGVYYGDSARVSVEDASSSGGGVDALNAMVLQSFGQLHRWAASRRLADDLFALYPTNAGTSAAATVVDTSSGLNPASPDLLAHMASPLVAEALHAFSDHFAAFFASCRRVLSGYAHDGVLVTNPSITIEAIASLVTHLDGRPVDLSTALSTGLRCLSWQLPSSVIFAPQTNVHPGGDHQIDIDDDVAGVRSVEDALLCCALVRAGHGAPVRADPLAPRVAGDTQRDAAHTIRAAVTALLTSIFGSPFTMPSRPAPDLAKRLEAATERLSTERVVRRAALLASAEDAVTRVFLFYATVHANPSTLAWGVGAGRPFDRFVRDVTLSSVGSWHRAADALLQHLTREQQLRYVDSRRQHHDRALDAAKDHFIAVVLDFEAHVNSVTDAACVSFHTFKLALVAIAVAATGAPSVRGVPVEDAHRCLIRFLGTQRLLEDSRSAAIVPSAQQLTHSSPGPRTGLKAVDSFFTLRDLQDADVLAQADLGPHGTGGASLTGKRWSAELEEALHALYVGYAAPVAATAAGRRAMLWPPRTTLKVLKDAGLVSEFVPFADVQRATAAVQLQSWVVLSGAGAQLPPCSCSSETSPTAATLSFAEFRAVLGVIARCLARTHCHDNVTEASRLVLRKLAVTEPAVLRGRLQALRSGAPGAHR
jgi:hypothetical protein